MVLWKYRQKPRAPRKGHLLGRLALILGLGVVLGGAAPSVEQMTRYFDLVVFHNEYREGAEAHLRRWVVPIRVYIDNRAGDAALNRLLVERHMDDLKRISGHDIAMVDRVDKANVLAVFERARNLDRLADELFDDAATIKQVMRDSVCLGRYYANGRYEIVRAVVIIPPDRAATRGKLPACVVEEFTQILGLPNDSAEVFPSIFNDRSVDEGLSAIDVTLIRLLYDKALYPGMPRPSVLETIPRILPLVRP